MADTPRPGRSAAEYAVVSRGRRYLVRVVEDGPVHYVSVGGAEISVRLEHAAGAASMRVAAGTPPRTAMTRRTGGEIIVTLDDGQYRLRVEPAVPIARRTRAGRAAAADLRAPIPGLIVSLDAVEGQMVEQGRPLVVMEAMKMQSELRAPVAGRVAAVHVRPGQEVMGGSVLVTIAPSAEDEPYR
jgi:biotin carboxyl carrier protein